MWDEYIKESQVFVIFYSKHWMESARGWLEYEYAKEYDVPVRAFVLKGDSPPEDFGFGFSDFKSKEVETIEDVLDYLEKLKKNEVNAAISGLSAPTLAISK